VVVPFVSDELLYGYTIFQHLEYRPTTRTLINIKNGRIKRFGTTKARLFEYLLSGMDEGIVYDNDIIVHVFEDHGLRCSRSYLLSMIKKIQNAFNTVGFERYPFARVDGKAYVIDRSCLERIYVVKTSS
jgi:two-component SAPR family response regulator